MSEETRKGEVRPTHLWEHHHPYYWTEGCYFGGDCHRDFDSWAEFFAEFGDADEDLNAVYRWDWLPPEEGRGHLLKVFFVMQRKAYPLSCFIQVQPSDEPAIREWLMSKWDYVSRVWAGIAEPPDPEAAAETVRQLRQQRITDLRAELARLESE